MRKYFGAWIQKSKSYLDFVDFVLFVGFFDWIFAVATFFTPVVAGRILFYAGQSRTERC